jgi:hypothetical protein
MSISGVCHFVYKPQKKETIIIIHLPLTPINKYNRVSAHIYTINFDVDVLILLKIFLVQMIQYKNLSTYN